MKFYDKLTPWNAESTQELLANTTDWTRQFVTLQAPDKSLHTSIATPDYNATNIIRALFRNVLNVEDAEHARSVIAGGWAVFHPEFEELIIEMGLKDVWELTGRVVPDTFNEREDIREEVRQHFRSIGLVTMERLF